MSKISATVITFNGEIHIEDCLQSLRWADEIIVVDSLSTDGTIDLARKYTDKIIQSTGATFSDHRNFAMEQASYEWIFQLDVDERVPDILAREIVSVINKPGAADGYYIPRRTFWLGKWIKHGGWHPDYALRLFRKGKAHSEGVHHERIIIDGKEDRLSNSIDHYSYLSVQQHVERMMLRSVSMEVREAVSNGVQIYSIFPWHPFASFVKSFLKGPKTGLALRLLYKDMIKNRVEIAWLIPLMPLVRFSYMYFLRLGFLDGVPGFWVATLSAFYEAVRYAKLWEHYYRQTRTDRKGLDPREVWDQASIKV